MPLPAVVSPETILDYLDETAEDLKDWMFMAPEAIDFSIQGIIDDLISLRAHLNL